MRRKPKRAHVVLGSPSPSERIDADDIGAAGDPLSKSCSAVTKCVERVN
jgi:hypothetical protein